jgi:purine-binding chemotaxis protein CheW
MMTSNGNHVSGAGNMIQCVTFYVGEALLGVPIQQIEEINRHFDLTPVPHGPDYVRGVINLRGEVVTVVDLRTILGLEPAELTRETRNVIVNFHGEHVGLIVDRVADVVAACSGDIDRLPANLSSADSRFYCGVYKLESELLALLDVEAVLTAGVAVAEIAFEKLLPVAQ